jgi:flagellar hook assembly protein FlgD
VTQAFTLRQNWPNPFNASTTISYVLPSSAHVSLKVYDILGREVATLVERYQQGGPHRICWDGTDKEGHQVSSGVYFYRLQAETFREIKCMTLLR